MFKGIKEFYKKYKEYFIVDLIMYLTMIFLILFLVLVFG
jgi:hypothetical protein